jgi:hypothetical protein
LLTLVIRAPAKKHGSEKAESGATHPAMAAATRALVAQLQASAALADPTEKINATRTTTGARAL